MYDWGHTSDKCPTIREDRQRWMGTSHRDEQGQTWVVLLDGQVTGEVLPLRGNQGRDRAEHLLVFFGFA